MQSSSHPSDAEAVTGSHAVQRKYDTNTRICLARILEKQQVRGRLQFGVQQLATTQDMGGRYHDSWMHCSETHTGDGTGATGAQLGSRDGIKTAASVACDRSLAGALRERRGRYQSQVMSESEMSIDIQLSSVLEAGNRRGIAVHYNDTVPLVHLGADQHSALDGITLWLCGKEINRELSPKTTARSRRTYALEGNAASRRSSSIGRFAVSGGVRGHPNSLQNCKQRIAI